MSLRRSPQLTPAALAARRANALKSTGPRTARGKARAALNALKHGRYTRDLAGRLARAQCSEESALWQAIRRRIAEVFEPPIRRPATQSPAAQGPATQANDAEIAENLQPRTLAPEKVDEIRKWMDQMANLVWCVHRSRRQHLGTKREDSAESEDNLLRLWQPSMNCARVLIRHPWRRLGLVFYTQRRRSWRRRRLAALLRDAVHPGLRRRHAGSKPDPGPEREAGLRSRAFRLARPRAWERIRYCLDRAGYYHPEWRGPYRRLRREMLDSGQGVWLEANPFLATPREQQKPAESKASAP